MPEATDPLLEPVPDFEGEDFAEGRQALIDAGVPAEGAAAAVGTIWTLNRQRRHEAWLALQAQQQVPLDPPANPQPNGTQAKQQPKAPAYPAGRTVPAHGHLNPSVYARTKLSKNEWVELWYFTKEGCLDADLPTTSLASDTFGLTTNESNSLQIRAVSTARHSPRAVDDTKLTWDQIMVAAKTYTRTLQELGFEEKYYKDIWTFYSDVDFRRADMRATDADRTCIHYVTIIRREFYQKADSAYAFDITKFSKERFDEIAYELRNNPSQPTIPPQPKPPVSIPATSIRISSIAFQIPTQEAERGESGMRSVPPAVSP
ncbi:hypothetical protein H0H81_002770 [Sphagnurus paluster]|uniref:Uncharacterized protein n=1 Tax=Sphagnurus paluster TaxID=117069 RepID=A0A9P7FNZ3_9AGAR|nr:hypothetical protein H0H81_002770 [Sphagnurus paluster]